MQHKEVLTNNEGFRIIGFGRFARLVGGYSGLRALGIRNRLFDLKPAHQCEYLEEMFTPDDMKQKSFRISVISDITCYIEGSIPSTKRASIIEDPFYNYNPATEELEPPFTSKKNITVQAVDNLPCELPKDASLDFGQNLIEKVFPSLFGKDTEGIIERATITKNGKLTPRFSYLEEFVDDI